MRMISLPSGGIVPALGLGTWRMGEDPHRRQSEIRAIQKSIDLGMTLIDTAEMYGDGASEEVVGEAVAGRRDEVTLVTKIYPHNATRRRTVVSCDDSLRRLRVDAIDLYLLHWRGSTPLDETFEAMAALKQAGKIKAFGVSNFDTSDMEEAWSLPHGAEIATNQILYNLTRRNPEIDLLPWCAEHRVPVMAYSPVEQGRLLDNRKLAGIARDQGRTTSQIALAWLLAQPDVIVIPKSSSPDHIEENRAAADIVLTEDELSMLNEAFPRPAKRKPLEML
jgi:diketogulonate reductase-like aldo/keto reductase